MSLPPTSSLHQQANQKEPINLNFYNRNIQPSPYPRSETITYEWDNQKWKTSPEKCLNDLLWKKHLKFIDEGPASLVGKIAVDIAQSIVKDNNSTYILSGITFQPNLSRTDIYANLGSQYSSYKNVIETMKSQGDATCDTANKILENLSKNYNHNSDEIFDGLNESAKRLMAFLICETIRFQEDGACARMATRMVIDKYKAGASSSSDPFKDVFVSSQFYDAVSIFAISGGKQRMINQIMNDFTDSSKASNFRNDKRIVNDIQSRFYSDNEDAPNQSNSNFNTANETSYYALSAPYGTHPMLTKGRIRINMQLKDPSSESSNNPTPIRTTSFLVKQSGPQLSFTSNSPGGTENNDDNYREEAAQHELDENQVHSSDNEEELNDSIEPSSIINNDFGEVNRKTVNSKAPIITPRTRILPKSKWPKD